MEHIVQFGINIDDEVIKDTIIKQAREQVVSALKKDCIDEFLGSDQWRRKDYTNKMSQIIERQTLEFLNEKQSEIIELVSNKLADKLARTKMVKEMVAKTLDDVLS